VKPEEGIPDTDLISAGEKVRSTCARNWCPVDLNRVLGGKALDHPTPELKGHLRVQRLDGGVVQGNVMGRVAQLPTQRDFVFGSRRSLETHLLLNYLRNKWLQPSRKKLNGRPVYKVILDQSSVLRFFLLQNLHHPFWFYGWLFSHDPTKPTPEAGLLRGWGAAW
jgi:hypothetical protein